MLSSSLNPQIPTTSSGKNLALGSGTIPANGHSSLKGCPELKGETVGRSRQRHQGLIRHMEQAARLRKITGRGANELYGAY